MEAKTRRWIELRDHLASELRKQGFVDVYDPDFILGVLQQYLEEKDLALVGEGVKRRKM